MSDPPAGQPIELADDREGVAKLRELEQQLVEQGIAGLGPAVQALSTCLDTDDEEARVAALAEAYRSLAQVSKQLLEGELAKVEQVMAETGPEDAHHAALERVLYCFQQQVRGLGNLIDYFESGDKKQLDLAKKRITAGGRAVESLAR